MLASIG
ncbi:uncharacterized protein FFNC_07905 [Fusarium fujikuroi]|nr:uncharacterized protein FFNC_07905 [Fusarium fujikuroi]